MITLRPQEVSRTQREDQNDCFLNPKAPRRIKGIIIYHLGVPIVPQKGQMDHLRHLLVFWGPKFLKVVTMHPRGTLFGSNELHKDLSYS